MNKEDLIAYREFKQGDEPFILSTWLKGLLFGGDEFYRRIPKNIYFKNHHAVIERILYAPGTAVKLAVLKEDPDVILGYAVYRVAGEITALDWVFIKKDWRGIGLAKNLCPKKIDFVTNVTRAGWSILDKYPNTLFNPYI